MSDSNYRNDDVTTNRTGVHNEEPATRHDINEGATIGAVGGAVVGAVAGGPVGAVIGAVAGGAASAGAVDVVDKHDHDYDRTVSNDLRSGSTYENDTTASFIPGTSAGAVTGDVTSDDLDSTTSADPRYRTDRI